MAGAGGCGFDSDTRRFQEKGDRYLHDSRDLGVVCYENRTAGSVGHIGPHLEHAHTDEDRRKATKRRYLIGTETNLLLRFPERCMEEAFVLFFVRPSRQCQLATVYSLALWSSDQRDVNVSVSTEESNEHCRPPKSGVPWRLIVDRRQRCCQAIHCQSAIHRWSFRGSGLCMSNPLVPHVDDQSSWKCPSLPLPDTQILTL